MLRLIRSLGLALCLGALPNAALSGTIWPDMATQHVHAKTCAHYANRARFKERHDDATLEVILADSCARAFHRLYHQVGISPYEARHAVDYLDRLGALKNAVIAINMDRMFGAKRTPRTLIKGPLGGKDSAASQRHPITDTGEYLIARQMGVIGAYHAWADVTDFVLAGAD